LALAEDESTPNPGAATEAIELPGKRTATSNTFELGDGTLETRLFQTPVNFRDVDGDWQPIEQELQETASGAVTNGDNSFDVYLPEDLDEAPIRVSTEGEWVSEVPIGVATEPADLQADGVASYAEDGGAASFDFTGLANGLKETITLSGPSAPATFHFALEASAGVAPSLLEDGSIAFRDEEGELVAAMPAPSMVDGAESPAPADAVQYVLDPQGEGRWQLAIEASDTWLSDPGRSFPVRIDPTVTIPAPTVDCLIANTAEFNMCGSSGWPSLYAKANYPASGEDQFARSLLRFDLSAIPKTASLTSATIGLYSPAAAKNVSQVDLYEIDRSWAVGASWRYWWGLHQSQYEWSKKGGDYGQFLSLNPVKLTTAERGGSQAGWWNFSGSILTGLVQRWRSNQVQNFGVLLKLHEEQPRVCCIERSVQWESSTAAPEKKPYLSVEYIPAASTDSKITSPTDGTKAPKRFILTSAWDHSNVEGVKFQYMTGNDWDGWKDIPGSQVIDKNNQTVSWPIGVSIDDRSTQPLYWDPSSIAGTKPTARIQIRAVLSGPLGASGYTKPVKVELNRETGGAKDAVAPIGPGSVDLLTGNFTVTRNDVSIPGFNSALSFSRSVSSAESAADPAGVLGPGWQPSSPVEVAGASGWQSLRIESEVAEFDGETFTYNWASLKPANGGPELSFEEDEKGNFSTPPELAGNLLYRLNTSEIAFTAPDGSRTVFSNNGSGNEYLPKSVAQTGGEGNKTRMIYEVLTGGKRRLKQVIAPSAPSISCSDEGATTTKGCRVLEFSYKPAKEWGAPASAGDRLYLIKFYAPGFGSAVEVAQFSYDTGGRLAAAWDPRISPNLKETYSYTATGRLASLTPPGQEPWTFQYGLVPGDPSSVTRLLSVKRASLVPSKPTAQTTIAYGVPVSGSAPYNMSPQEVAKWGQEDLPTDATAIFPPDEVPASPPSSYAHAAVYYMDAEGQVSNVATPAGAGTSGPSITTAETDVFGNVSRELTAENRIRALAAGSGSTAKSRELDTLFHYSADGSELLDERGPIHAVRLESGPEAGTIVQARSYRAIQYDLNAPEPAAGVPMPQLPTTETSGALVGGKVLDQQSVQYGYNWPLRQKTEQIVDPEGLKIKSVTAYDPFIGLPLEVRQPKDATAAAAGTTKFIYYKKEGPTPGECEKDIYAGMLCKAEPAVQPTGRDLPVTYYAKYTSLGQPEEVVESVSKPSTATRKTVILYDAAGRQKSQEVTGGDATQIPKVEMVYSNPTGLPVTQQFVCPVGEPSCDKQSTTTTYDALGRVVGYQDADGNSASATYDVDGRVSTINDGKGSQTISYDNAGQPAELTDSMAGTFTASYDADGQLVQQGLPNGLTATTTVDAAGAPTQLTYVKASNCGTSCTWLNFEVTRSATGGILTESGTLGSMGFSYDAAGRLTKAKETPPGGSCTTRIYAYDPNSNRTSTTTRSPGVGGACSESGGTAQEFTYDSADRLTSAGTVYDLFGRITTLPSSVAGGGSLQTGYFSNDMVASQTQGAVTNTYGLDATLRHRQRIQAGGLQGVEVFHYASAVDAPAWTQLGESWTRNVSGIGGRLVAIAKSGMATRLQLTNLHGDIVATASIDPSVSVFELAGRADEFGKPLTGTPQRFGWLGGLERRTELASGVVQMGVRSYVPSIGRFLSADPVRGGSANAYDYANQDPINSSDLMGEMPGCSISVSAWSYGHRLYAAMRYRCPKEAWPGPHAFSKLTIMFERHTKGLKDELLYGKFEVKSVWYFKPKSPYDEHWRWWGADENWRCGDLGREYQVTYIANVYLQSPYRDFGGHMESFEDSGRAVCAE